MNENKRSKTGVSVSVRLNECENERDSEGVSALVSMFWKGPQGALTVGTKAAPLRPHGAPQDHRDPQEGAFSVGLDLTSASAPDNPCHTWPTSSSDRLTEGPWEGGRQIQESCRCLWVVGGDLG